MSSPPELRLDWCSHDAARYAVRRWYYNPTMPQGKLAKVGVWERGRFAGVLIYSPGSSSNLLKPYGLHFDQGCELTRLALGPHEAPMSRIMAVSLRLLKKEYPGLRLVVTFSDPAAGHHGGVYQAGGWVYAGTTDKDKAYIDAAGRRWHSRLVSPTGVKKVMDGYRAVPRPQDCTAVEVPGKHRYLMPLDDDMRRRLAPLAKPYPKRVKQANPGAQPGSGGAAPTHTLHSHQDEPEPDQDRVAGAVDALQLPPPPVGHVGEPDLLPGRDPGRRKRRPRADG